MAPVIDKYLIPAVALIVLLSVIPILIEVVRGRRENARGGEAALADGPALGAAGRGGRHRKR
jgi:membrane-associated protein